MHILIVEDNPVFQASLVALLQQTHPTWVVHAFARAHDALAHCAQKPLIDLALIDVGLPDMDGLALLRKLHTLMPAVPMVVITVIDQERKLLNAIKAGARGYLLKSDPPEVLLDGIHSVLDGHCLVSPKLARALFKMLGSPASPAQLSSEVALTKREVDTLRLLAKGLSYSSTAQELQVALSTVQSNVRNIYRKLDVSTKTEAVLKAQDAGLI